MNLVKVLRLRESQVDINGRLSYMVSQTSNYKGAISDVRLEVYHSTAVGPTLPDGSGGVAYDEFELKFIELFKLGIAGQPPEPDVVKKYENIQNQYGDTTQKAQDYVIKDFIERNAFRHLQRMYTGYSIGVIQSMSKDFYTIVQDPWQDEPPLTRIYGYDPYFLNNGVEVRVRWYGGTQSVTFNSPEYVAGLTGGFVYSNNDGTETYNKLILSPGNTPSNPFVQNTQDIEFAKSEKKKISKSIIAVVNNTQPNFYTIADSNQIVLAGTGSYDTSVIPKNFTGDTIDDTIIKNFIDLWKTKVPNYDLKLCTPSYYPNLIDLEVIPPFDSQNAGTPSNDGQTVGDNTPEAVKFNLSIVYDTFRKIKAGEDLPDIKIYVGNPPKEGEFLFDEDEFDDTALLDEEYQEVEFKGLEEILADLAATYTPPDNKKDEQYNPDDPDRGSDGAITYIDGVSTGAGANNNNEKVRNALKKATDAVGKGESGRCARYTFNHANNFVKALIDKPLSSGANTPAGGNANQDSYHNALVKLGYKKSSTTQLSKSELKKTLETKSNWDLGDVVAYWGISTAYADKGGVKYGHTQIFTDGVHGTSNKWTSDNYGNFGCAFVYNSYKVDTWKLVILKSPTSGKKVS